MNNGMSPIASGTLDDFLGVELRELLYWRLLECGDQESRMSIIVRWNDLSRKKCVDVIEEIPVDGIQ